MGDGIFIPSNNILSSLVGRYGIHSIFPFGAPTYLGSDMTSRRFSGKENIMINVTPAYGTQVAFFFGKLFSEEDAFKGSSLINEEYHKNRQQYILNDDVVPAHFRNKKILFVDQPPTKGLIQCIKILEEKGFEVHLRDHHGDNPRDSENIAIIREILGERAMIVSRKDHLSCLSLIKCSEFRGFGAIVADSDFDGVLSALWAIGFRYTGIESDSVILDGPTSERHIEDLSPFGLKLFKAWGGIPSFGTKGRDEIFQEVVLAFYLGCNAMDGLEKVFLACQNGEEVPEDELRWYNQYHSMLDSYAQAYDRQVLSSREIVQRATLPFPGFRYLEEIIPQDTEYDPPTLAREIDHGVLVSAQKKSGGVIGKIFGTQITLVRTKEGEQVGINLSKLVPDDWGDSSPENGVISNTPFLLHLSPERWEAFCPILKQALSQCQK